MLAKASAILDCLEQEPELTAGQLAARTGEPRSTTYRLLDSLRDLGFVEPGSGSGTVRLGLKLFRLGGAVMTRFDTRQAALPVLERLQEATGETIFLAVRRGLECVCIERLEGERVQSLALRLGGSLPLHAGAVSRALLAFEPETVWRELLDAGPLERFTEHTIVRRADVVAGLREVRARGYAISDEDVTLGIAAIGAPIFNHQGEVCAALSISGVKPATMGPEHDRLCRLAVAGAAEISAALGAPGA